MTLTLVPPQSVTRQETVHYVQYYRPVGSRLEATSLDPIDFRCHLLAADNAPDGAVAFQLFDRKATVLNVPGGFTIKIGDLENGSAVIRISSPGSTSGHS